MGNRGLVSYGGLSGMSIKPRPHEKTKSLGGSRAAADLSVLEHVQHQYLCGRTLICRALAGWEPRERAPNSLAEDIRRGAMHRLYANDAQAAQRGRHSCHFACFSPPVGKTWRRCLEARAMRGSRSSRPHSALR